MVLLSITTVPLKKPKPKITRDLKIVLSSCVWDIAAGFRALGWSVPMQRREANKGEIPGGVCCPNRAVLFRDIVRSYLVIMGCT